MSRHINEQLPEPRMTQIEADAETLKEMLLQSKLWEVALQSLQKEYDEV